MDARASFTLIELLVVIAIVTVLAVVVVLVLNPAQLLKQARDSTRLSDMANINSALNLFQVDVTTGSLGAVSTTYISVPDLTATSTAGTNCAGLGLPSPPSGWGYHCAASSTYRLVNGTGWMPVDFTQLSFKSPFGTLPVDPINTTSSGDYYTYTPGSSWALSALLESDKYLKQSALTDGGYDPGRFEIGSDLSLVAKSEGLQGWWTFDEGSGSTVSDSSGNSNNATWNGTGVHYVTGKVGGYAGQFNGTDDFFDVGGGRFDSLTNATVALWFKYTGTFDQNRVPWGRFKDGTNRMPLFVSFSGGYGNKIVIENIVGGTFYNFTSDSTISAGTWYHVAVICGASGMKMYVNGAQQAATNSTVNCFSAIANTTNNYFGQHAGAYWSGLIDDARIYSRVLTAAEIAAIYNATK